MGDFPPTPEAEGPRDDQDMVHQNAQKRWDMLCLDTPCKLRIIRHASERAVALGNPVQGEHADWRLDAVVEYGPTAAVGTVVEGEFEFVVRNGRDVVEGSRAVLVCRVVGDVVLVVNEAFCSDLLELLDISPMGVAYREG